MTSTNKNPNMEEWSNMAKKTIHRNKVFFDRLEEV